MSDNKNVMVKNENTYPKLREKFDYTRWRRQFFGDKTVSEINEEAADYSRNHPFKPRKPQVPIQREG